MTDCRQVSRSSWSGADRLDALAATVGQTFHAPGRAFQRTVGHPVLGFLLLQAGADDHERRRPQPDEYPESFGVRDILLVAQRPSGDRSQNGKDPRPICEIARDSQSMQRPKQHGCHLLELLAAVDVIMTISLLATMWI